MRNLILFLVRYNAFFLFIILEIISFSLIVRNGTDTQKKILFSSANGMTGFFMEKYNNTLQYWNLPEENEKLAKENAQLKGYTSSYVVAYKDGQRIALAEALKYVGEQ